MPCTRVGTKRIASLRAPGGRPRPPDHRPRTPDGRAGSGPQPASPPTVRGLLGDDAVDEGPMPRTVSLFLPLLVACTVLGVACAARAEDAAQRAVQGAGELLERGKAAVGLGREDPEGRTATGVSGGVPFLVRFKGTVGGLKPGDPVEVRGMRMGAVREVRIVFDPAA